MADYPRRPERHGLEPFPVTVLAEHPPTEGLVVYRLLFGPEATYGDFEPRARTGVGTSRYPAVMTRGISVYLTEEAARKVMTRPESCLARVVLTLGHPDLHVAHTSERAGGQHCTIWGRPEVLLPMVEAVFR